MKIGLLVKQHIRHIFSYCDTTDHNEITSLLKPAYSKDTLGIHFPFCIEIDRISADQSKRYWTEVYVVRGKRVRVTSQWYETSRVLFLHYLAAKGITPSANTPQLTTASPQPILSSAPVSLPRSIPSPTSRVNSRYRGNAIGNAQNAFIRTILSNIGQETFSEADWEATKDYFSHRCVYCGQEAVLVIDHAIPINKDHLGEHRLGNLVPSCQSCNSNKAGRAYDAFLADNPTAITRIETYMDSRNYVPLEENEQMKLILAIAHKEVAALADRYITIINELFGQSARDMSPTSEP